MSGHSKWSTIKRQKGLTDKSRGQTFTKLSNAISIAVREGSGVTDPNGNIRLRLAIEKARAANMPKGNIERAVERASGKGSTGATLETVVYEGFAPGSIAVLVEGVTDNKQRTAAQVKNIFTSFGGTLGSTGSVNYLFEKIGQIVFSGGGLQPDQIAAIIINSNASDFEIQEETVIVYTLPEKLHEVALFLKKQGLDIGETELTYRPLSLIPVTQAQAGKKILQLLEALESLDDIQRVHANFELSNVSLT